MTIPDYTLSRHEIAIVKLSQQYMNARKLFGMPLSHNRVLPIKKDPRMGQNWKHFEKLYKVLQEFPLIDPFQYITAQIIYARMIGTQCPCSWLASEKSMERFAWYLDNRDTMETKFKKDTVDYITMQYENLKTMILFFYKMKKEHKFVDWYDFFTRKHGVMPMWVRWFLTGNVSKLFLAVSKSYRKAYKTYDADIREFLPNPEYLTGLRTKVMVVPKIKKLLKRCFQDDVDF